MDRILLPSSRRRFLQGSVLGLSYFSAPGLFAEASTVNPADYQSPTFQALALNELDREEESTAAFFRAYVAAEKHLDVHPDDARAMYLGASALVAIGETEKAREP